MKTYDQYSKKPISFTEARAFIEDISVLGTEQLPLTESIGRTLAEDMLAVAACPSVNSSLKDGYAVISTDVATATVDKPVDLRVKGALMAGDDQFRQVVRPGEALRIMTGAELPQGADAILASEFTQESGGRVQAFADAFTGRNILQKGADVTEGSLVVSRGTLLQPGHLGLMAAAGLFQIPVYCLPKVIIVATGSELVLPGNPIGPGKVAASNMVNLQAELTTRGYVADTIIIRDDLELLHEKMLPLMDKYDVMLTCGGVLDGDKDYTMQAMENLGVEPVFHRVRVGPGKGIAMGRRGETLIFNLPGGPPSNHVAFLLLALPGICRRAGCSQYFPSPSHAIIDKPLKGKRGWTQVVYGKLHQILPSHDSETGIGVNNTDIDSRLHAMPIIEERRLQAMAAADCLIELPEDVQYIDAGEIGRVWKIR